MCQAVMKFIIVPINGRAVPELHLDEDVVLKEISDQPRISVQYGTKLPAPFMKLQIERLVIPGLMDVLSSIYRETKLRLP